MGIEPCSKNAIVQQELYLCVQYFHLSILHNFAKILFKTLNQINDLAFHILVNIYNGGKNEN